MRDVSILKRKGATVYYRDRLGSSGEFDYVKGTVIEFRSVKDAKKEWGQQWNRGVGTILKIAPKDSRVPEPEKAKYRHLSSVLTEEQYHAKKAKKQPLHTK